MHFSNDIILKAPPLSSILIASAMFGTSSLFTTKPGVSEHCIATFPMSLPNDINVDSVSGDVSFVFTTCNLGRIVIQTQGNIMYCNMVKDENLRLIINRQTYCPGLWFNINFRRFKKTGNESEKECGSYYLYKFS